MYADLHCHTVNSDGEMVLPDVIDAAEDADLRAVAITDHDRLHPDLDDPVTTVDNITVIHGIELRVETDIGERVDLLGYGATPTPALTDEIDRLQADRADRAQCMIDRVEDYLNIDLRMEGKPGMGRPNIARAVAEHPYTDYDYEGVFDEVIGHDCPGYVARDVTDFERGVELLDEACQLVGLAHPFRYDDPEAALKLTDHLDAVECYYPYGEDVAVDSRLVDRAVDAYDLIRTGGSDAHDFTLGRSGLTEDEFTTFCAAADLDVAV